MSSEDMHPVTNESEIDKSDTQVDSINKQRSAFASALASSTPSTQQHRLQRIQRFAWLYLAGLSVIAVALLGRTAQLQHTPTQRIADRSGAQTSTTRLIARRGTLTDRTGRPLAVTQVGYRLFVDPYHISDQQAFVAHLGFAFGYDPAEVGKKLYDAELRAQKRQLETGKGSGRARYVVIDHRLTDERLATFHAMQSEDDFTGLYIEPLTVRDYPQRELAGQIIGGTSVDGQGIAGLEAVYNEHLSGSDGNYEFIRDPRRRPLWVEASSYQRPTDGRSIKTSLDLTIQAIAERELQATIENFEAKRGQLVVMNPNTGELLAVAHYPRFDPSSIRTATQAIQRNRTIADSFEPGSIMKPFIWAGLTQRHAAKPDEMIDCTTEAVYRFDFGRRLKDHKPIGNVTWRDVLARSSNIGMGKVAMRISKQDLYGIVESFGFGQETGLNLPGETVGIVRPLRDWNDYSRTSIPMGHEINVTPMQIMRAFCTIATDGYMVNPTFEPMPQIDFDRTGLGQGQGHASRTTNISFNSPVLPLAQVQRQQIIQPDIARVTRSVLRDSVNRPGHGVNSALYPLYGKSGTAELPKSNDTGGGRGYFEGEYISSFIGGGPYPEARLIVGCFIYRPNRALGHYGAVVAGPAVRNTLEQSLQYLGEPISE